MITQITYRLGLTGWPLGHSLSPLLHKTFFNAAGISGYYDLYPVPPNNEGKNQIKLLLDRLEDNSLHGLNVTIPHKQTIIPFLDDLTPSAHAIGAVNAIHVQNDLLTGDNTDAPGFMADLDRLYTQNQIQKRPSPPFALVLGAGGSARAVSYALSRAHWQVTIASRRLEQALSLSTDLFDPDLLPLSPISLNADKLAGLLPDLIVNTTPIGMSPNNEATPWPDEIPLPTCASLYDLVYNPQETRLVKHAREAGLTATTGLGMLIEQAALAFYNWTGLLVSNKTKQKGEELASIYLISDSPIS